MKNLFLLLILLIGFSYGNGQSFPSKKFTRGATAGEYFVNMPYCFVDTLELPVEALFHTFDNGLTLSIERQEYGETGWIFGDPLPGTFFIVPFHNPDSFAVTYDYGETFICKHYDSLYMVAAGSTAGEIYTQEAGKIFRSIDYGDTFTYQGTHDTITLDEVGTLPGELYAYHYTGTTVPVYHLAYSNDYGQSFTYLPVNVPPPFQEVWISRGALSGEFYLVALWGGTYTLYHTFDYGSTLTLQKQFNFYWQVYWSAGREPGTFYFGELGQNFVTMNFEWKSYYSSDYGVTYTSYIHELGCDYTDISENHEHKATLVFPNPAHDHIKINLSENVQQGKVTVYDLFGRSVMEDIITSKNPNLVVSALEPGVYFLTLTSNDNIIGTSKVVIR